MSSRRSDRIVPLVQDLSGRTGIVVLRGIIDEVLPRKVTALVIAGGVALGDAGQYAGALSGQRLLAVEVATVG